MKISEHVVKEQTKQEAEHALEQIVKFWIPDKQDKENGGFYFVDSNNIKQKGQPKNLILQCRILWFISSVYEYQPKEEYLRAAREIYDYLREKFMDPVDGGLIYSLDSNGEPLCKDKYLYESSFAIYALTAYYTISKEQKAFDLAKGLFHVFEEKGHDSQNGGYYDAFNRQWEPDESVNGKKKTLRTYQHLLEAYLSLYKLWPDEAVRKSAMDILDNIIKHFYQPDTGGLWQTCTNDWQCYDTDDFFGDDIECSWLFSEAINVLSIESPMSLRIAEISEKLAYHVLKNGVDQTYGGIFSRIKKGKLCTYKIWWENAEAINGFLYAYETTGNSQFLQAATDTWKFVYEHQIAPETGEWYARVKEDGTNDPFDGMEPEKCPYHNGRVCLHLLRDYIGI